MLRSISWKQFQEWRAFDDLSPIGDRRGDWQAASIGAAIANTIIAAHGGTHRFKMSDLLLDFDQPPAEDVSKPVADWRRLKSIARMFVAQSRAEQRPRPQPVKKKKR